MGYIHVADNFILTKDYVIALTNYSVFKYDEILMLYKNFQFQTGKGIRNGLHDIIVIYLIILKVMKKKKMNYLI